MSDFFLPEHQDIIQHLLRAEVEFIIIGGYSVIYHGYMRTTGDLDIWLKPDYHNREKMILALKSMNIEEVFVKQIAALDFTKHLAFTIGEEPAKVDFITHINLVTYDEADKLKIVEQLDDFKICILNLDHLVLSKINTERLKDKADVEMLQKIQQAKQKKGKA